MTHLTANNIDKQRIVNLFKLHHEWTVSYLCYSGNEVKSSLVLR